MKIAVIQHRLRETAEEDLVALGDAAATATDMGAEVVVFPRVPVLADQSAGDPVISALRAVGEERSEQVIYLNPMMAPEGAHVAELPLLGKTALLVGDACMDPVELGRALMESPASAIVAVGAENDLQAEAVLELALGLSESLAGLVIVAEASGAEPGDPGHGGSVIVLLGAMLAEAIGEEDVLVAEIDGPVPKPEPREPLPEIPPLLEARLAHHRGQKPDVDYPADLS